VHFPLIGIDPGDPYGKVITNIFTELGLTYDMKIRARFGTTVCSLVKAGLGIAVIDQFTVAYGYVPGVKVLRIEEPTSFDTWVASKAGAPLSAFATNFIRLLREELEAAIDDQQMAKAKVG
jgi:DNA-binding transcriptional LysR family regulator